MSQFKVTCKQYSLGFEAALRQIVLSDKRFIRIIKFMDRQTDMVGS